MGAGQAWRLELLLKPPWGPVNFQGPDREKWLFASGIGAVAIGPCRSPGGRSGGGWKLADRIAGIDLPAHWSQLGRRARSRVCAGFGGGRPFRPQPVRQAVARAYRHIPPAGHLGPAYRPGGRRRHAADAVARLAAPAHVHGPRFPPARTRWRRACCRGLRSAGGFRRADGALPADAAGGDSRGFDVARPFIRRAPGCWPWPRCCWSIPSQHLAPGFGFRSWPWQPCCGCLCHGADEAAGGDRC